MQTRRFTRLSGMILAGMLTLLIGQAPVFGHDHGDRTAPRTLEGTWNVTLTFPCSPGCPCPGGMPNIPIPALQMYLKHGSFLEAGGGTGLRSPGLGSWERTGHDQFEARFKFFRFDNDMNHSRQGSEEVTSDIHLTGHDTFEATATTNSFDATGNRTSPAAGCSITGTATRFE